MSGELHHGAGARSLRDVANSGTAEGGGFAFDEATLRTLVTSWLELADSYQRSTDNAENMVRIDGPGSDYASWSQAEAANASGRSYATYLQHSRDYCLEQAQQFQNALDDYLGVEHTNVTEINKTGSDGPQAGV